MKSPLRASYRACRQTTRRSSSTFWLASLLFDSDTRHSIQALYAFCRTADDITDGTTLSSNAKIGQLRLMRQALITRQPVAINQAIWPAVFDTINHHKLPTSELEMVLRGVARDIRFHQPASYSELDEYSYMVAGVVGVLSARVLGAYKQSTLEGAKQLGIAMQYTNIIRDVKADQALGRVYLPLSVMRSHNLSPQQLATDSNFAGLQRTLGALTSRAETFYQHAEPSIADLHSSYQLAIWVALELYRTILDRVKQKQYNVLEGRIRLNRREKITVAWNTYRKHSSHHARRPNPTPPNR